MWKTPQVFIFYKAVLNEARRNRGVVVMSALWLVASAFSTYLTYSDKLSDTPVIFSSSLRQVWSRISPYIFVLLVLYLLLLILFAAYRYHTRTVVDLHTEHEFAVGGLKARIGELTSELARPRFGLKNPKIYESSKDNRHYFDFDLENVGSRPASDLSVLLVLVEASLDETPFKTDSSPVSEIWMNKPMHTSLFIGKLSDNEPSNYIILGLKYGDLVTKESYKQVLFMKWKGIINGVVAQDFTYLTIEDQQKLMGCLSELLMDFVSNEDHVRESERRTRQ
jgi:hypothetical protein